MAIVYPLTAPAEFTRAARFNMRLKRAVAMTQSPFSGAQQVVEWPAFAQWTADLELAASLADKGRVVEAFIDSLHGMAGTFLMGPLHALNPRGTATAGTVNGGGQTGNALAVNIGASKTLLRGDFIQVGSGSTARLHRVVEDASADGSGLATLTIEPFLRFSPTNGSAVVVVNPVGLWRLNSNEIAPSVSPGFIYEGVTFPLVEAL